MRVFLVRHTPVDLPDGTCYGRTDVGLAPGWEAAFAGTMSKLPPDATPRIDGTNGAKLYSSPRSRCLRLAQTLGLPVTTDERLGEYDFGEWELRAWAEIPRHEIRAWAKNLVHEPPPGGERLIDVARRAEAFFTELTESATRDAIVLTHGGIIRCLLAQALNMPLADAFRLNVDYGSVSLVRLRRGTVRVEYVNR